MIYLDYNATTPVDPMVLEAMLPYFSEHYGNAGSRLHAFGWAADEAVNVAREQLATLIDAESEELIFTSGATEALNLAIRGVAATYSAKGKHLVTVQTEHKAVLETYADLAKHGFSTTFLGVNAQGCIDLSELQAIITPETILVSVMWANNETGVLQDIPQIYEIVKNKGALFLTDATQALGKVPVSVAHCDLLACSGHKFYAPKGVGALYMRRRNPRVRLLPLITGGGQERGLRGGTLNVPGIVGLGKAAEIAAANLHHESARLEKLRDAFETALLASPRVHINGQGVARLPNTTNVCIANSKASELLRNVTHLAASTGSACSTANPKPSHVLKAMGLSDTEAYSVIRFSMGRMTTEAEITAALEHLQKVL